MSWRTIQRKNFRKLSDLLSFLELSDLSHLFTGSSSFPLNVPFRLAQKMQKKELHDPILRQFVPLEAEKIQTEGYKEHPMEEQRFRLCSRLLQKYQRRALLLTTSACAMHCRYCFRKNYPYETAPQFTKELQILKKDPSLLEVILSGGDPLSLSNNSLFSLLQELNKLPQLRLIRFHTRFVMGIPERIDASLLALLRSISKQLVFVIHANHPKEFDTDIFSSLKLLSQLGIPILCQSVLLKGVNDSLQVLQDLCELLLQQGILPYYLHQLDPIQGGAHFYVDPEVGRSLILQLKQSLPGYGVFRYVQEIPGEGSKTSLFENLSSKQNLY